MIETLPEAGMLSTIKIKSSNTKDGYEVINTRDFNLQFHEVYKEAPVIEVDPITTAKQEKSDEDDADKEVNPSTGRKKA